jgi:fumarate reductase flavoprotein subunit
MDIVSTEVAIIGAGLRAAIAVAERDPSLRVALISKVYPMRSHTVVAEGGAAGVIKADLRNASILKNNRVVFNLCGNK